MKKMIVLMIGLGVILGGCRKKEKQEESLIKRLFH